MILGLTGGIGSGKSTVARVFELMGAAVFNSDEAAKQAYFIPQIKEKVIQLLGPEAYTSPHELNRAYIASLVFENKALLQQLNVIIHPAVKEAMKRFENANPNTLLVKETALLFEAGLQNEVDKILVVVAPDELRIQRCMQRDKQNREQVLARMAAQIRQEEKAAKADFVIYNDESQSVLKQVELVYKRLNNVA